MRGAGQQDRYLIIAALLWATVGGALIGGLSLTAWIILDGSAYGIYEAPWLGVVAPFMFAGFSFLVTLPCTLLFGIPSALFIDHFALSKWPALAVCVTSAFLVQIACIWLLFWHEYSEAADYLFTAPFALGAAIILWWRLAPSA